MEVYWNDQGLIMYCTPGKALSPEIKETIVTLKSYFDRNKVSFAKQDSSAQMVSDALGIGLSTVNRVMARYRKDPSSVQQVQDTKGHRCSVISESNQAAVRSYIRQGNLEGRHITLEGIKDFLYERSPNEKYHITTLGRTLNRWGFEFGKGVRTQHLKEKDSVILSRQKYLRKKRGNRSGANNKETVKPEVYLDESYLNKNHSNDFTWYYGEDGPWIQKPTGKGERLIIMNAISQDGWIPGARNIFRSSRNTGDYHGQMDAEKFHKWFLEKLLPNIPSESLIIMDNAPYHKALAPNSPPTPACRKAEIRKWLEENGFPCSRDCLKVELVEILKTARAEPLYMVDILAEQFGHEVLRTPPYHPELQPIEICWAIVKNEVGLHCDFTMKTMEAYLERAFKKVTGLSCKELIQKIQEVEDNFLKSDAILDQYQ